MRVSLASIMAAFRANPNQTVELEDDDIDGSEFNPRTMAPARIAPARLSVQDADQTVELERLRAENERIRRADEERARQQAEQTVALERTNAERFAQDLIAGNYALPAERDGLTALHAQAAADDRLHPLTGSTRLSTVVALTKLRSKHNLATEQVATTAEAKAALSTLPTDPVDGDELKAEDRKQLRLAAKNAISSK